MPLSSWQPTTILRYVESIESSTQVIRVKTDAGDGFLKAIGNPEGEHVLACELVGTQLARWFGLPTFDFAIIEVTDIVELRFRRKDKGKAGLGPAFITRREKGDKWSGSKRQLKRVANRQDIARLVVFDTWIRNFDRYHKPKPGQLRIKHDNVFLSERGPEGKFTLLATDHTHAFTNKSEIIEKHLSLDAIRDDDVFGLFPAFEPLDESQVQIAADALRRIDAKTVRRFVAAIPREWDVSNAGREALVEFILKRAHFLSEPIPTAEYSRPRILTMLWPQGEFFPPNPPENAP